ncbi:hypothetical protein ACFO9Q_09830 [Paenibacillus sp. GCM10023252]
MDHEARLPAARWRPACMHHEARTVLLFEVNLAAHDLGEVWL